MSALPIPALSLVLPHQGRMLLLDELVMVRDDGVVAALTIRPDDAFCDGAAGVPAWVGMEYMAQTACAFSGVEEAHAGRPPSISLLLGTRAFRAEVPAFPVGVRLLVDARLVMRDEHNLAVFDCAIREASDGRVLAVGDIKAIRPEQLHLLLERQHGQ